MNVVLLSVAEDVSTRHPDLVVAGFAVSGLEAFQGPNDVAGIEAALTEHGISDDATSPPITSIAVIRAWRAAIGACGLKPSAYQGSVEQLLRRAQKERALTAELPAVAAYCGLSLRYLSPLGGYDVAMLPVPAIELRLARPGDQFTPLFTARSLPLSPDVAVYASDRTILTYAFNHRDSAVTGLGATTKQAVFLREALDDEQRQRLRTALRELAELMNSAGVATGPVLEADSRRDVTLAVPV
jgi:DNA/RNA-binding domain of Phe-tRNA-synthetase-like protein